MILDFPNALAGSITVVAIVVLGIFIYPWLLKQKGGAGVVAAITVLLTFVFYTFDRANHVPIAVSAALALLWALAPVIAGTIVFRIQRKAAGTSGSTNS